MKIFQILIILITLTSIVVITVPNPMYSLFFLVISFLGAAILLIKSGLDYIGLTLIILYIGAIAVIFTFVIMLLTQTRSVFNEDKSQFCPQ